MASPHPGHAMNRLHLRQPKESIMKRIALAALLATGIVVAAPSFAKLSHADLVGEAVSPGSGFRTIRVTPKTRAISVELYETVNLDIGGKVVTWRVDGVRGGNSPA